MSETTLKLRESQMENTVLCCSLSQSSTIYAACDGSANLLVKKIEGSWLSKTLPAVLGYVKQTQPVENGNSAST